MRTSIAALAVVLILMASGLSFAQPGWHTNSYQRCAELASRQGLNAKSTGGRRFVNRCMQRGTDDRDAYGHGSYRPSRNCPDDPKARSAYPAWMCR